MNICDFEVLSVHRRNIYLNNQLRKLNWWPYRPQDPKLIAPMWLALFLERSVKFNWNINSGQIKLIKLVIWCPIICYYLIELVGNYGKGYTLTFTPPYLHFGLTNSLRKRERAGCGERVRRVLCIYLSRLGPLWDLALVLLNWGD